MKILKRALLINWHYITYQIVEFDMINFLTGKNRAGKSTAIDGMLVTLLGDKQGSFFNKAANVNANRTLKGYLCCEIADDGGDGFLYKRNPSDGAFTSYIALEFYDDVKNKYFVLGAIFDTFTDGSNEYRFFILQDKLPNNNFINGNEIINIKDIKAFLNSEYNNKYELYTSQESYKKDMRAISGGLKENIFNLLRKAASFTPITNLEKFINEFVCDTVNEIDIEAMAETIRDYKQLEMESLSIKRRIEMLGDIKLKYDDFRKENDKYLEQKYLIDRADIQCSQDTINLYLSKIEDYKSQITTCEKTLEDINNEIIMLESLKSKLNKDKDITGYSSLKEEELRLNNEISNLKASIEHILNQFKTYGYKWSSSAESLLNNNILTLTDDLKSLSERLLQQVLPLKNYDLDGLMGIEQPELDYIKENMDKYKEKINEIYYSSLNMCNSLMAQKEPLNKEIETLQKGIKSFNPQLVRFKDILEERLSSKFNKKVTVDILCDLLDVKDKRWLNAIEGYLNTQKFHLLVDPDYYVEALRLYKELKDSYYNIGIVDIGRLTKDNIKNEPNSLAEEIITDSKHARVYIDYLLGKVIKSDDVDSLNRYRVSITDSCMLYKNYVAKQLDPKTWSVPYLGKNAVIEQLNIKQKEFEALEQQLYSHNQVIEFINSIKGIEPITTNMIENTIRSKVSIKGLKEAEKKLDELKKTLRELENSTIFELVEKIDSIDKKLSSSNNEKAKALALQMHCNEQICIIENESLINEKTVFEEKERIFKNTYKDRVWIEEIGEPRYIKEHMSKESAKKIVEDFRSTISRTENQRNEKKMTLTDARTSYAITYQFPVELTSDGNDKFDYELQRLSDTYLHKYEEQIKDAKEKAYMQFQDDFLSKLKLNIDTAGDHIRELNEALKDVSYDGDKYKFTMKPNPTYKDYYELITDTDLMSGHTLWSDVIRQRHGAVIDELFNQLMGIGEASITEQQRQDLQKKINLYKNYQTYVKFDLEVNTKNNITEKLSKTIAKKSGGETQTPFYICVLASFVQAYRIRQRDSKNNNCIRLILFDEAFSKMDEERYSESIKLLRKLGLQAILAAPPDKISAIGPLVDRNLIVTNINHNTQISVFDPKKDTWED